MSTISFSGLASGIDSSSLIAQLVAVEKQPEQQLEQQQSDDSTKKTTVDSQTSALSSFGDLVGGMSLDNELQFRTASASDAHVTVAASGTAIPSDHDVRVLQLARAQVTSSRTFTSDQAGMLGSGSLTISGVASPIAYDSTDTLESIAQKINNLSNSGVTASVLNDGSTYRLMVSATQTGTTNAPTFTETGDALGLSDPANIQVGAQDAKMSVDGVTVTRPTNVFDDVLPGVTLTAVSPQATTDADTSVSVNVDRDQLTSQLQQFVSGYNGLIGGLQEQLDYSGTTKGTDTLFGDSTLEQLEGGLQDIATSSFGSMSLADLGITIDKTGAMSLDTDTLNSALDADPNAASKLFVDGGLANAVTSMTDAYTRPGDGILVMESQGFTDDSNDLQTDIDNIDQQATDLQTRLQDQFTALEQTMSTLQSQSSYIAKILA